MRAKSSVFFLLIALASIGLYFGRKAHTHIGNQEGLKQVTHLTRTAAPRADAQLVAPILENQERSPTSRASRDIRLTIRDRETKQPLPGAYAVHLPTSKRSIMKGEGALLANKAGLIQWGQAQMQNHSALAISAIGYVSTTVDKGHIPEDGAVYLDRGASYEVRFVNTTGLGVSGVTVTLSKSRLSYDLPITSAEPLGPAGDPFHAKFTATSGEDGRLKISGLAPGEFRARVSSKSFVLRDYPAMRNFFIAPDGLDDGSMVVIDALVAAVHFDHPVVSYKARLDLADDLRTSGPLGNFGGTAFLMRRAVAKRIMDPFHFQWIVGSSKSRDKKDPAQSLPVEVEFYGHEPKVFAIPLHDTSAPVVHHLSPGPSLEWPSPVLVDTGVELRFDTDCDVQSSGGAGRSLPLAG